MNDARYSNRVRKCLLGSMALHGALLLCWPMWSENLDEKEEPPADLIVELALLEPIPEPEKRNAQPKETKTPEPDWTAFVYANEMDEELATEAADVISATTEQASLAQGEVTAVEAGTTSDPDSPSAAAAPSSVAVPLHAQVVEKTASTLAQEASEAGAEESVPNRVDADFVVSGDIAAEAIEEEVGRDDVDIDGAAEALESVDAESDSLPEPPSMAFSGAAGAVGGSSRGEQAIVESDIKARRTFARRSATPMGRYTNRMYDTLRRRWHRHDIAKLAFEREVTVRFEVARGGAVSDTIVVMSSGDPLLDAMARASVPRRLAPFPPALNQLSVEQEVTFRYQP